ncbi:hypothetical protein ACPWR0_13275 [Pandoraea pneumonica]|uniref:hypothetical protein n=1 Tax=Pandoraea pneumonica TaxID=2508299 RepID=UPI003CE9884D
MTSTMRYGLWRALKGLLIVSVGLLGACQSVVQSTNSTQPTNYALPTITMHNKNGDQKCSFSLYDGGTINFKDTSNCDNDKYYTFEITGAHEGMAIEFHDAPSCNGSEPHANYVVSFKNGAGPIGSVASTSVEQSMGKSVGTRLTDGAGNDVLIADGYRSGQLVDKVSCVKVSMLLPDGPFRIRSRAYPDMCLTGNPAMGNRMRLAACADGNAYQMFFEKNDAERTMYAAWVPREKNFIPFMRYAFSSDTSPWFVDLLPRPEAIGEPLRYLARNGQLGSWSMCVWAVTHVEGGIVVTTCGTDDPVGADKWSIELTTKAQKK